MEQDFKPIEDITLIETPTPLEVAQPIVAVVPDAIVQPIKVEAPMPIITEPKPKTAKKAAGKTIFTIFLVIFLIAAGAAAYWWRDKTANDSADAQAANIATLDAKVKTLEAQLANADSPVIDPIACDTPCAPVAPSANVIENIKLSITSGNTAALEGYMAASVKVVLAASGGTGSSTPTQAVSNITEFISDATSPWNFAIAASILTQYAAGSYGSYFPSIAVVGASANNKLISFDFDCSGKINTVFLVTNQSILQ